MWGRKGVWLDECPKSYIAAESEALVEEFLVWRRMGGSSERLSARQVDAFVLLEKTLAEVNDGRQHRSPDAGV